MPNARSILKRRWSFNALLIALVLALYAASINFGLIWDDPSWYQQGAGQSLGQLFTSLNTYQFYRPLVIGLNRLLVAPNGIVNAALAHLIQIAAHLITTLAVVPLLRVFKFDERTAQISAVLFAIYPLSYQAVAWQAPQQPIATLAVFVALLAADRFMRLDQIRYLIVSLAAYAFGLLFQESALPFVLGFFWLAYLNRASRTSTLNRWWPLLHFALALAYFLVWLNVPRQAGVTGRGLQLNVLAYGLQAIVFPIASLFSSMLSGVPGRHAHDRLRRDHIAIADQCVALAGLARGNVRRDVDRRRIVADPRRLVVELRAHRIALALSGQPRHRGDVGELYHEPVDRQDMAARTQPRPGRDRRRRLDRAVGTTSTRVLIGNAVS